jgi:predicted O-linked N-acetylglucosamine transferase (SPINDLY family)
MANAGLHEFITSSKEEYAQRVIEYANDLHRLDQVRQSLKNRLTSTAHPGQTGVAPHLQELLRQVWRKWCDAQ